MPRPTLDWLNREAAFSSRHNAGALATSRSTPTANPTGYKRPKSIELRRELRHKA